MDRIAKNTKKKQEEKNAVCFACNKEAHKFRPKFNDRNAKENHFKRKLRSNSV